MNVDFKEAFKGRVDVCVCTYVGGGYFVSLLFVYFACPAHFHSSSLFKHSNVILGITHRQLLILRPLMQVRLVQFPSSKVEHTTQVIS